MHKEKTISVGITGHMKAMMYKDKILTDIYREIQSKRDTGKYQAYFSFTGNPDLADIVFEKMQEIPDMEVVWLTCNPEETEFYLELDWEPAPSIFTVVLNKLKEMIWKK
jgi:hypothetical protein